MDVVAENKTTGDFTWRPSGDSDGDGVGFGENRNNTFTSSNTSTPALTVKSGTALIYGGSGNTNTFGIPGDTHTNLKVEGGVLDSSSTSSSSPLTNRVHGNIEVSGGELYMFNSTNDITGDVSASSDGIIYMLDSTNEINGNIDVSGGTLFMINVNQPCTNTMNNLTLTGGTIFLGGANASTTISNTLTLGGGDLAFYHNGDGDFGAHHAGTLSVTEPSTTISIVSNLATGESHPAYSFVKFQAEELSGTKTLMTFDAFTGDPRNITVNNADPFTEVYATDGAPQGLSLNGTELNLNIEPVATAESADDLGSLSDAASTITAVAANIQGAASKSEKAFQATRYQKQRNQRALRHILQQRGGTATDKLSNVMMHLAQNQDSVMINKFKGNYRVWLTPYFHAASSKGNRSALSGFNERYYGMMLGGSHYLKDLDINLRATLGLGLSHRDNKRHKLNNSNGKHAIFGLSSVYNYIKGGEITSSLFSMYGTKNQSRFAQPDPNQHYLAKAKVSTLGFSWMNDINYVHKLDEQHSVRPSVGLYLGWSRRKGFSETNIPTQYAQKYKTAIDKSGEAYTGLGYRYKFAATNAVESKVTAVYEVGYKSGNGRSTSSFSSVAQPNAEAVIRGKGAGRVTHYLNLYGSVLNKENNWKVGPGVTAALQAKQRSLTTTLKVEYRF